MAAIRSSAAVAGATKTLSKSADKALAENLAGAGNLDEFKVLESLEAHADKGRNALFKPASSIFGRIITHRFFDVVSCSLVVLNAIWIGIDTDAPGTFAFLTHVFCFCFTVELMLRFLGYQQLVSYFTDPENKRMNLFDLVLVLMLLIETYGFLLIFGEDQPDLPAFSLLRLLRLARLMKLLRSMPEIAIMVKSLAAALRSAGMTICLAILIIYVFSIILTQWASLHVQRSSCEGIFCMTNSFGTIPKSFLSLTQILCFDNAFALIKAVLDESFVYGSLTLVFIVVAALTLLNILIGIICQIITDTKEEEYRKIGEERINEIIMMLDLDASGRLSSEELSSDRAHAIFRKVGFAEELLERTMRVIDKEKDGSFDTEEFKQVLLKLMRLPEALDVLIIQRRLSKLEAACRDLMKDESSESSVAKVRFDTIGSKLESLESQLVQLEYSEDDPIAYAEGTVVNATVPLMTFEETLLRLDGSLSHLRSRLGHFTSKQNGAIMPLQPLGQLCQEMVQTCSAASEIISQVAPGTTQKPSCGEGAGLIELC